MEEIVGNDYRFRLNRNASNYQEILSDIRNELSKNEELHYSQNQGSWQSHFHIDDIDKIVQVIMVADYTPAPINLSADLFKKIKENIKTNPDEYYAYSMDRGLNEGVIKNCEGIAKTLADKISDTHIKLYNKDGQETFKYYINNLAEMSQLDRYGEAKRLKKKLLNNSYDIVFNKCLTNEKKEFNELWTVYFLVNGTKDLLHAKTDVGSFPMSLKEILYFEDNGKRFSTWGKNLLEHLTIAGVRFDETTDDISGNLLVGGKLGDPLRKVDSEAINKWFKKHKSNVVHYPKFTDEVLETLKTEFPATYEKLNRIMESKPTKGKNKHLKF
jgi:hypothetical protein